MVLYCSGHSAYTLRLLVHQLTYFPDEESVIIVPEGTSPFSDSNREFTGIFKKVIIINFAVGINLNDENEIISAINAEINGGLQSAGFSINDFSEIFVSEDIYHPYTIFLETNNIEYTTLENAYNAFKSKSSFSIENNLLHRTPEYFTLAKRLGAFDGTGKFCKKRVFDIDSDDCFPEETEKSYYDYSTCISSLPKESLNKCFELFSLPDNIPGGEPFHLLLTNSQGLINDILNKDNRFNSFDYICRMYQTISDFYLSDCDNLYLKPHPLSDEINYEKFFDKNRIIDNKFLVDLMPFGENVFLSGVVTVASTSLNLLKTHCSSNLFLGFSFFDFYFYIRKIMSVLEILKGKTEYLRNIYTLGISTGQLNTLIKSNHTLPEDIIVLRFENYLHKHCVLFTTDIGKINRALLIQFSKALYNDELILVILNCNDKEKLIEMFPEQNISIYNVSSTEIVVKTGQTESDNNVYIVMSSAHTDMEKNQISFLKHSKNKLQIVSSKVSMNESAMKADVIYSKFKQLSLKILDLEEKISIYRNINRAVWNLPDYGPLIGFAKECTSFEIYVDLLEMLAEKYMVIVTTCDTPGDNISEYTLNKIHSMGFTDFNRTLWRMYVGVSYKGNVVAQVSNEKTKPAIFAPAQKLFGLDLKIGSHAWSGCGGEDKSEIFINNINYSVSRRGVNIVVYDAENNCLIDSVVFDWHSDKCVCFRKK